MRYGVFVHEPDGDMGYGSIVGAFKSQAAADEKADAINRRTQGAAIEAIPVALLPGSTSITEIIERVRA